MLHGDTRMARGSHSDLLTGRKNATDVLPSEPCFWTVNLWKTSESTPDSLFDNIRDLDSRRAAEIAKDKKVEKALGSKRC